MGDTERFWGKVIRPPGDECCWEWQGALDHGGYGKFGLGQSASVAAHRFAYSVSNGSIPPGQCVLHRCNNRRCVRPDHLYLGYNRHATAPVRPAPEPYLPRIRQFGEASPLARLTAPQVAAIRATYAAGLATQRELGERFGVSHTTVGNIIARKKWRHVP